MKRLFACFLAVLMLMLPGCEEETTEEKKDIKENATTRYFFYIQEEKLCCLDTETQKSYPISNANALSTERFDAKVSKDGKTIAFLSDDNLYLWGIGDKDARLIDTGVSDCRPNDKMDVLLYEKENKLYVHSPKYGSRLIITTETFHISMSEDGTSIILEEKVPDAIHDGVLYKVKLDGSKEFLTEVYWDTVVASADHSVICYLKFEGEPIGIGPMPSWPAYQWTIMGEKRLPFEASSITVFAKDEIYYTLRNGERWAYYYFDGKESRMLHKAGNVKGSKVGDHFYVMYTYADEDSWGSLVAYEGETVYIPKAVYRWDQAGGISQDGETFYIWVQEELYAVSMKGGKLVSQLVGEPGRYTPSRMTFRGESLLVKKDGLYLNDQQISAEETDCALSMDGKNVAYLEDATLYRYFNKKKTKISDGIQGDFYALKDGNVLYYKDWQEETGGTLCLNDGEKETVIGQQAVLLNPAYPLGSWEAGNMIANSMVHYTLSSYIYDTIIDDY